MLTPKRSRKFYKGLIIGLAVIAIAALAYGTVARLNMWWPFLSEVTTQNEAVESSDAANQEDPTYSSDKIDSQEQSTKTGDDQPKANTIDIGISSAEVNGDTLEIRAFTTRVVEAGTCTATLEQGAMKVSGTSNAFVDASTSQCHPIVIPLDDFPAKGAWRLVVTYQTASQTGTSAPMEVAL